MDYEAPQASPTMEGPGHGDLFRLLDLLDLDYLTQFLRGHGYFRAYLNLKGKSGFHLLPGRSRRRGTEFILLSALGKAPEATRSLGSFSVGTV